MRSELASRPDPTASLAQPSRSRRLRDQALQYTFVTIQTNLTKTLTSDAQLAVDTASLNLALIGNCAISALIDQRGSIVWCCLPRFDSAPVFHALLSGEQNARESGRFCVELERMVRTEQVYDAGTAVVRTTLFDDAGQSIEIVDFAPRFMHHGRMFRPAQLVRRVRALTGHPRIRIAVQPTGGWTATTQMVTRGTNHLRFLLPEQTLRLTTDAPLTYVADQTWFSIHTPINLMLGPDETLDGGI